MLAPVAPPFTGTDPLDLTPDQIRAARACGCLLTPATEAQVQRLTTERGAAPLLAAEEAGIERAEGSEAVLALAPGGDRPLAVRSRAGSFHLRAAECLD